MESKRNTQRLIWVDNVKIIAIALVVLGHLYQGFTSSKILPSGDFFNNFNSIIYYFHVPLFFICSGYLFEHFSKERTLKAYSKNILKKLIALGIPYFVFAAVTYIMKTIFSSDVNNEVGNSAFDAFFLHLMPPYWFLYVLFIFFLINPVLKSKADGIIRMTVSIALYVVCSVTNLSFLPTAIRQLAITICLNLVWFVFGMVISKFNITENLHLWQALFFVLFIAQYFVDKEKPKWFGFFLTLFACMGIIALVYSLCKDKEQPRVLAFFAKYTMPVFLMHTIFAAGVRIALLKIGITNAPVHIIVGIFASFVLPVLAAMIMEKIKLDFLYNPTKYIKIK